MKTAKKPDQGHFAQTPILLLNDDREGITSYTLAVYAAIHSYITFGKTTGAHPNTEQIATRAHCSVATVERERERLKKLGYMTWIPGSFRLRKGNEYTLLFPSHRGDYSPVVSLPQRGSRPSHRGDHVPPIEGTQRTSNREPVTEKYSGKCSHPDTACCPRCIVPIAVSPSPKPESQDDDFSF